ncbi:MAG TPA: CsbD family protein [Actinomycetota bacterium]
MQKQFEGRWDQVKGKVKETWGDITDDELDQTEGKWEQLVGKIKAKTGESQEEIERKLGSM